MHVLNLVTRKDSRCYRLQVETLESMGVETTTLAVPRPPNPSEGARNRRLRDYVRFYPDVLSHSFDGYDLIHVNYGLTGPAAIAQPNLPVVLGLWGSDLYGAVSPISRLSARFSDEVVVMSEQMAEDLGQECHVVPHGVDTDLFQPQPQARAQAELGWDPEKRHVLFPYSRERDVKDFPRAQRIVEQARERVDESLTLQWATNEPHDRMPLYMNAADVMLMTSKHEGSPNATKEALACNLPVVATDVGDLDEQLDGVSHSRVCRTDRQLVDALVAVVEAGERSNGRRQAQRYSLQRMGDELVDVYESALN